VREARNAATRAYEEARAAAYTGRIPRRTVTANNIHRCATTGKAVDTLRCGITSPENAQGDHAMETFT